MENHDKYLSVSNLNYCINLRFKNNPYLHQVLLKGELSNFRYRRNSHQYFSLKNEEAKISVVVSRSAFEKLKFKPKEGMKVYVSGYTGIYPLQGTYQFCAQMVESAGLGELYEKLRQLQDKLSKEGLFAAEHKKKLPRFPGKITVVTSASGAVIRSIVVTANRRFPHTKIDLFPAQVQGDTAAEGLVNTMNQIKGRANEYDVTTIGRGGGSLKDLWPFNGEIVIRSVYSMPMPVISSMGHKTDTTSCDLAADVRTATPTAAAEYATPSLSDELVGLHQLQSKLLTSMQACIRGHKQALLRIQNSSIMREPMRLYDQQVQSVDQLTRRLMQIIKMILQNNQQDLRISEQKLLAQSPKRLLERTEQSSDYLSQRLLNTIKALLKDKWIAFRQRVQILGDISPLKVLSYGYVYTTNRTGETIMSTKDIAKGEVLNLHFADGKTGTKVLEVKDNEDTK